MEKYQQLIESIEYSNLSQEHKIEIISLINKDDNYDDLLKKLIKYLSISSDIIQIFSIFKDS